MKADFPHPSSETLATEFVGTLISSGCCWKDNVEAALSANPHVKIFNGDLRGYVRCDLTPDSWRTDFRVVSSPKDPNAQAFTMSSQMVKNKTGCS